MAQPATGLKALLGGSSPFLEHLKTDSAAAGSGASTGKLAARLWRPPPPALRL